MNRTLALAALLLASCRPEGTPPDLHLSDAWARETLPGQTTTAAYLEIVNRGGTADTLVSVTSPIPSRASLHTTDHTDGIARMRPIADGLAIPAGETVKLSPGAAHIMVENLAEPLRPGETLRLTLRFTRSGEHTVNAVVREAAVPGPPHPTQ